MTIDGVAYEYLAEICIVQGTDFVASGPGQGPDGTPAWVEIESSVGFDFDGDGTDDPSASVSVSVGQTELFGSGPDDQPHFYAETNVYDQSLTYTLDGGRMTGSGDMRTATTTRTMTSRIPLRSRQVAVEEYFAGRASCETGVNTPTLPGTKS